MAYHGSISYTCYHAVKGPLDCDFCALGLGSWDGASIIGLGGWGVVGGCALRHHLGILVLSIVLAFAFA